MQTLTLSTIHSHPPLPLTRLSWLDRVALHSGIALIRWADRSHQQRELRFDHTARTIDLAQRQAEQGREDARLRASMLFPSVR